MEMNINESDRVVVAKPVATRPSCSSFRSFSELLAGAINASPPNNACSETAVPAIRPKTVRFKPVAMVNHVTAGLISISQVEDHSGKEDGNSSDKKMLKSENSKPSLVYKPQAKLVSERTFSMLANMGNSNDKTQQLQQSLEPTIQNPFKHKHNFTSQLINSNPNHSTFTPPTNLSTDQASKMEEDPKSILQTPNCTANRSSYDGYNWRKYGQKQVKGSEYPRSYYKCTHPNCPVKKKVERSLDGQIAEIVYKGEHNHAKSQPPKQPNSAGTTQGLGVALDGTKSQDGNNKSNNNQLWSNGLSERNEGSEGGIQNQNEMRFGALDCHGKVAPDNSCGVSGDCEEGSKGFEVEDDQPKRKRRKGENQWSEAGISGEGVDPRIVMQDSTDSEMVGDGFRWRKYGQKVVKGNPYPRSYYKCTSLKCNVRKHVERASDDPKAYITTYEGKHNHEMPRKNTINPPPLSSDQANSKTNSSKHKQ